MANPTQYIFPVQTRHVEGEQLVGVINGSNVSFQTASAFIPGKIAVYLNGLKQREGVGNDYTEISDTMIQMNNPPLPEDTVYADYLRRHN